MSFFHENMLIGSSGQGGGVAAGYQITRSLRFNSADSAYLSRTPASAGNRKTWTFSCWVKRASLGRHVLLSAYDAGDYTFFQFNSSDQLAFEPYTNAVTAAVFRDFSAWYHIVCTVNTTLATQADRVKIYVNGIQQTLLTSTGISQNADTVVNSANIHNIASGYYGTPGVYVDGYLAEVFLIDGQALTPSSFGETDTNGVWQPKAYTGSYGTNGFHLSFSDNSTAAALGTDTSGNGNTWTVNNLSVTAGAGNDSLVDTPTSYGTDTGAGGEVRGNYCTWNATNLGSGATLANGNLDFSAPTNDWRGVTGTFAVSTGKWYWEITLSSFSSAVCQLGIEAANAYNPSSNSTASVGSNSTGYAYRSDNGNKINNNSSSAYGASFAAGDVVGVALDLDAGTLVFYKNGASQGTAFSSLSGTFNPAISCVFGTNLAVANFGQRPFAYTAPSGFKALCTQNLPTPTIAKGATAMDVVTYTGTGATLTPTSSLGFSPDLVWIKSRSAATDNTLYDVVRGAQIRLESNNTDAEVATDSGLTAFNSDGFTLGTLAQVNTNTATYAAWCWDAGSSTVTNTQGSITSQVRANASAGFSIVTYTGTGANATVGHGLGAVPGLIIIKERSQGTGGWITYHSSIGATGALYLNATAAVTTASSWYNNTAPTSTVFSLGANGELNDSGQTNVAYCWTPVAGYSSFGSYTGNGSADGPFVYLGFRPAVVLVKMSSSTGNWTILDDKREGYNVDNDPLYPNLADAEGTTDLIDITSNGFKVRTTDATFNTNAGTYIYAAWASSPFAYARAR